MIFDNISNIENYRSDEKIYEQLKKLADLQNEKEISRFLIKNVDFENAKFENHRKNIDVQFIIKGKETILISNKLENLVLTKPYDESKDCEFFVIGDSFSTLELSSGDFLIIYPGEAHAPNISDVEHYKAVMKITV